MSSHNRDIAAAFSGHRFRETYDHLAPNIVWVAAGGSTAEGRDGVISTCEETLAELANTTTEFTRFLTVADDDVAAVDVIGRYTDPAGGTSTVASCDIYEFRDNLVARITSYTVEIDTPASAPPQQTA
jgi:ketosteroid isomerase-like protein